MLTGSLILFPLILSVVLLSAGERLPVKPIALAGSLIEFLLSLYALFVYMTQCHCQLLLEAGQGDMPLLSLRFGMDGLSMIMVLLTAFLVPVAILSSFQHEYSRSPAFYVLMLFMETAFIGTFMALNGWMFCLFWIMTLAAAYLLAALWGGSDWRRNMKRFFFYTFPGCLALLGGLIYLFYKTPLPHSFDMRFLYGAVLTPSGQGLVFCLFFLGFAVLAGAFPFHG